MGAQNGHTPLKPTSQPCSITVTTHYYTTNKLYEQSLDIYQPFNSNSKDNTVAASDKPIIALVIGSAWLGHRAFIYSQTSWWNSSCSKTVAKLGYTCVCIRHRGAFPRIYSVFTLVFIFMNVGMVYCLISLMLWYHELSLEGFLDAWGLGGAITLFMAVLTGLLLMELGGHGSASFDQMQNDVMDALAWFDRNRESLLLGDNNNRAAQTARSNKIIFGGYSSGGHVAATVMQQPDMWTERNLPVPEAYCSAILYISPVLCTKPYHNELQKHLSSLWLEKMSTSSSLSSTSHSSSTPELDSTTHSSKDTTIQLPPPCWLTNHLIATVFGYGSEIPSSIANYAKSPSIPHIFIGCNNEMFGLNWLDLFFASRDYSDLLKRTKGVDSTFVGVDSDHWNILGSRGLMESLERELRRVQQ